jgi:hypothetical protein
MPITNLSTVTFTAAEVKKINDAIADIKSVIVGKTTNLTDEEKQLYGSINESNKLVVQKVLQYAASNPEVIPAHVDKAELLRDYESRNLLEDWKVQLELALSNLTNTKILLDYDVFQSCLSVYRNARYLANEDMPGMNTIYNDLKQFFPGGRPSNTDTPTQPTT